MFTSLSQIAIPRAFLFLHSPTSGQHDPRPEVDIISAVCYGFSRTLSTSYLELIVVRCLSDVVRSDSAVQALALF